MTISQVSERYGLSADTLRYYERIGLIPPVPRTEGGVRDYDAIVKIQSEARKEFPDAFVVAYEGDKRIDVKTARRKTGQ